MGPDRFSYQFTGRVKSAVKRDAGSRSGLEGVVANRVDLLSTRATLLGVFDVLHLDAHAA